MGGVWKVNQNESQEVPPGLTPRVIVSIVVLFGGLIFAIIYVAFFAVSFSLFQKIAVVLVVLLVMVAILGVMWASWGIRQDMERKCRETARQE
jgi:protein-S-isoprenylcysteine O-methyltransferase Ste14